MFDARGTQVAEELRDMFVGKGSAGFELNYQSSIDKKVGK